jgi:hypothetical protein
MAIMGVAFGSLALLTARRWQFYATFALLGIVGTGLSPVGYSRAVSTWFDRRRGVAFGLVFPRSVASWLAALDDFRTWLIHTA